MRFFFENRDLNSVLANSNVSDEKHRTKSAVKAGRFRGGKPGFSALLCFPRHLFVGKSTPWRCFHFLSRTTKAMNSGWLQLWTVYLDDASESEVGNFDDVVVADENVASSKVAMDVVLRLEVRHSTRDLCRDVNQLRQLQSSTATCQRHQWK